MYCYNKIDVKVNFEAQSSLVCIFLFFWYTQKKKKKGKEEQIIFFQNLSYNQN